MPFGTKLRELREKAKLTQEELAHKADISVSSIAKYEGQSIENVTLQTAKKLAAVLASRLHLTNNIVLSELINPTKEAA